MCGKDFTVLPSMNILTGSPPHVRERLIKIFFNIVYVGITPACAGKTFEIDTYNGKCGDHPRMCGKD